MAQWNSNRGSKWKSTFRKRLANMLGYKEWQDVECRKCKCKANEHTKIEIHHALPVVAFPEFAQELDNAFPLCTECHDEFHRKYDLRIGIRIIQMATPDDLIEFLQQEKENVRY